MSISVYPFVHIYIYIERHTFMYVHIHKWCKLSILEPLTSTCPFPNAGEFGDDSADAHGDPPRHLRTDEASNLASSLKRSHHLTGDKKRVSKGDIYPLVIWKIAYFIDDKYILMMILHDFSLWKIYGDFFWTLKLLAIEIITLMKIYGWCFPAHVLIIRG